ncbi:GTPase HflX [Candidatus Latescibacterota bacterium]
MQDVIERIKERAILVGLGKDYVSFSGHDPFEELRLLVDTAGADVVGRITQSRPEINPAYFIGRGKVDELRAEVEQNKANVVVFDSDLTPAQASNLEKMLAVKIIDRSGLILDIFAQRARTREAKTQVELAQLKYLLPRLTRQWTHLSRQQGGIGIRGPGETQLEVDRRRVRQRISHLTDVLKKIETRHSTSRKKRLRCFKVALVGYTNTGKSTLLNALSGAGVPVENKLFKTLDSVTRQMRLDSSREILISDTVGFIRNLPHDLIASFKSTLDDVRDADALLHVVDINNPEWEKQIEVVAGVLSDLGVAETETIFVFNKIDRISNPSLLNSLAGRYAKVVSVSGKYGQGVDVLKNLLIKTMMKDQCKFKLEFGPDDNRLMSDVYRYGTIIETHGNKDKVELTFTIPRFLADRLGLLNKDTELI